MTKNIPTEEENPNHGHLGASWEIAIVIVFIILIATLLAVTVFQIRRRRKRKQRQATEDPEGGPRERRLKPKTTHKKGGESRTDSSYSEETTTEVPGELRSAVDAKIEGHIDGDEVLAKPPPTAQPKRSSKSSYHEHIAKKPPKYYWDYR